MKIIIAPAKKMDVVTDFLAPARLPRLLKRTEILCGAVRRLTIDEAKRLWACNDTIARLNYERFQKMELTSNLTPALLSYEGIQYQHMAPQVFTDGQWEFVQEHLRILSGFYGVLRPLDGIVPYRLEMQAKLAVEGCRNLYEFWNEDICRQVAGEAGWILNLASKEYFRCIEPFLEPHMRCITCVFGEERNGKIIQKGTLAKMARGEMVRFLSENNIQEPEGVKEFSGLGFSYDMERSGDSVFVFLKHGSDSEN